MQQWQQDSIIDGSFLESLVVLSRFSTFMFRDSNNSVFRIPLVCQTGNGQLMFRDSNSSVVRILLFCQTGIGQLMFRDSNGSVVRIPLVSQTGFDKLGIRNCHLASRGSLISSWRWFVLLQGS